MGQGCPRRTYTLAHMRWVVRRATVADADALASLAGETFPLACPPGLDEAAVARHIRERLSPDAFRINLADVAVEYAVALDGHGETVGYVMLAGMSTAEMLELRQIYVRADYQGSGLADELIRLAIDRAGQLGLPGVYLGTSKVNRRAIAFYQRHGFRIAGERVFLVADEPNDDWILIRRG